jgi:beta-lactam-binding protein with PASTA domain
MSWQTNNSIKNIWKNVYFRNILFALATLSLLIFSIKIFLDVFTRHGESEPVPDFVGKKLDSVMIIAKETDLRIEVIDSVFRHDFPKGSVSKQNPDAGTHVKKNRKIYLTVNALSPRKEAVPNVVGASLRQAKSLLVNKGFRVGRLDYVLDIASNNVLEQIYGNRIIEPGMMLPVGTTIDLKLGLINADSTAVAVIPNVVGLDFERAIGAVVENSLNYVLHYDRGITNITDSINAVVYKQDPENGSVRYGSNVNLYLRRRR